MLHKFQRDQGGFFQNWPHQRQPMRQTGRKGAKPKAKLLIFNRIQFTDDRYPNASADQLAGGSELTDLYMRIQWDLSILKAAR